MEPDDIFYEAPGAAWALVHLLRANEIDFESVLNKKNALASVRQIIRDWNATQDALMSPMAHRRWLRDLRQSLLGHGLIYLAPMPSRSIS